MHSRIAFTVLLLCAVIISGCGGGATEAPPPTGSETAPDASEAPAQAPAVIKLEDGWAINDIITPEDVGAVTGKKMTYFPEASSAAQNGKPKAGYTNDGAPNSKLFISVDVAGGEEGFESNKQFTEEATIRDVPGLGDAAIACSFPNDNVGVIVLRGDAVIRIDWPPAVYGDDAEALGAEIANLLMGKMFE
ncbi:MAG: hypothetical protein U1E26_08800 [Coriobacteriia bacterium]|nr:hypothetical protein [Coriobacteriia bacterium]